MKNRTVILAKAAGLAVVGTALVAALGAGCGTSTEQDEEQGAAGALRRATGVEWIVGSDPETGAITFAAPKAGPFALSPGAPDQTLLAFLDAQKAILKMHDPRAELVVDRTERAPDGTTHLRFRQKVKGVAVHLGTWGAHFDAAGRLASMSGNYVTDAHAVATVPATGAEAAATAATSEAAKLEPTASASELRASEPALEIFSRRGAAPVLAWSVTVSGGSATKSVAWQTHIDATSGAVLLASSGIRRATASGRAPQTYPPYNVDAPMMSFPVSDTEPPSLDGIGPGGVPMRVFTFAGKDEGPIAATSVNPWADATTPAGAAIAAQANGKIVLDYYADHTGPDGRPWIGVDGSGRLPFTSVINDYPNDPQQAGWNTAQHYMSYGDGDPATGQFPTSAALDTVAHEVTHGLTQFTSQLQYIAGSESAAIEESTSDVFAALITHRVRNDDAGDFTMGEDGDKNGVPFRSMIQPTSSALADGPGYADLATLRGRERQPHYDSTLPSHAFYLLTHGDVHAISRVKVPCGIGWAAADKLYWALQTRYMQPAETFKNLALHSLAAARDLGINRMPIACAWVAVGVLTDEEAGQWDVRCARDGAEAGAADASDNMLVVATPPLVECSVSLTGGGVSLGP